LGQRLSNLAAASCKRTAGGNLTALIALTDAGGFRFPEICSQPLYPEMADRKPRKKKDRA